MATDRPMQLGMIGLGRMGSNLVRRLMRDGHDCVAYDRNPDVVKGLAGEGADGANSLQEFDVLMSTTRTASMRALGASALIRCGVSPD